MRCKLEYGKAGLEIELPDERIVRQLGYKTHPPLPDPESEIRRLLEH